MPDKHQCVNCGLLAVRNLKDSYVYPADELLRGRGLLPIRDFPGDMEPHRGVSKIRRSDTLLCYVGRPEMNCPPETYNCTAFINAEHDCPRFTPWIRGKTPKEHEEMGILEQVRAEQAIFRIEEEGHNRTTRNIAIGSLVVAAVAVIPSIWGVLFPPPAPQIPPPVVQIVTVPASAAGTPSPEDAKPTEQPSTEP